MILVSEIIRLPTLILIAFTIATEIALFIFIETHFQKGYLALFEPTKEITIQKTNLTAIKFNEIISNGLYRYLADLKTIGKHMSNFLLEGTYDENYVINKNSKFYKNYENCKNKYVFYSDYSTLFNNF